MNQIRLSMMQICVLDLSFHRQPSQSAHQAYFFSSAKALLNCSTDLLLLSKPLGLTLTSTLPIDLSSLSLSCSL